MSSTNIMREAALGIERPKTNYSELDAPIKTDGQIGQDLIAVLHRGGVAAYYWTLPDKLSYWHLVDKNGVVPAARDVYFPVHPTKATKRNDQRATKKDKDVCAINCVFVEVDAKDRRYLNSSEQMEYDRIAANYKAALGVHKLNYKAWVNAGRIGNEPTLPKKEKLVFEMEPAKAKALAHVRSMPLAPSVIIDSGGGYHCYWLLEHTFIIATDADRSRITRLQAQWVDVMGGDTGAKDLERVLRVPGTTNGKYDPPRPVTVIDAPFTRYTLAQIEALAPTLPDEIATASKAKTKTTAAQVEGEWTAAQIKLAARKFCEANNIVDILKQNAYSVIGNKVWRPGKSTDEGESGNIKNGCYWSFSSSDADLGAMEAGDPALSAFAVWTIFDHDGDEQAATSSANVALDLGLKHKAKSEKMDDAPSAKDVNDLYGAQLPSDAKPDQAKDSAPKDRRTCDDIGNGYRFADQHQHHACYVDQWGWMVHNGKRWERDITGMVMRMAKRAVQSIWDEVKAAAEIAKNAEGDEKERAEKRVKILTAHAAQSRSLGRLNGMLTIAQSEMPAKPEDFDKWPLLLNTLNGTVDLVTGELRKHNPADMITKCCAANYEKGAAIPLWLATLERFLPTHFIPYMKRSFGLLTSGLPIKAFWFFHGASGDNGKSTMTGAVANALGDYAVKISIDVLTSKHRSVGDEDQIAHLAGARFALGNEVDSRALNEKLIKDLTGEMDTIRTKFFGVGTFEFKPQFKLFLYGNKRPELDATDQALWNRVQCVPFERSIPKSEQISNFAERLKAEAGGILAWLVEGFMEYQRDGLNPPIEVVQAAADYRAEMDTFEQCINECFVLNPSAFTKFADIKTTVESFTGKKWNNPDLVAELKRHKFTQDRGAKGVRGWRGLGLVAELAKENDAVVTEVTEVTAFSIRVRDEKQKSEPSGKTAQSGVSLSPLSPRTLLDDARELFEHRGEVKLSDITDFLDELSIKTGASEADCVAAYQELVEGGELLA